MTTTTYQGFLYGHYDSRGGGTFIASDSREAADAAYCRTMGWDDPSLHDTEYKPSEWAEEDFIAQAVLESHRPLVDGEDLEQRDDGQSLWTDESEASSANIPETIRLRFTPTPDKPEGEWYEGHYGEDACGVLFWHDTVPSFTQ